MKIIYLAFSRIPTEKAHGLQIMKTCEALARNGAAVTLVLPRRHTTILEDPFSYYRVKKNFELKYLSGVDWVRWGRAGFLISLVWFSEQVHFLKDFWNADIVYSRDALVLAQYVLLGRRLVYEAHKAPTALSVFVGRRAYRLVVISEALRGAFIARGVRADSIIVAPDAVDVQQFALQLSREAARSALRLVVAGQMVVYTGHLYARKGVHTLAVAAKEAGVETYFVGGTPEDVRDFRAVWGGVRNIHIIGHRPPTEVPLWLKAADVLVVPNSASDPDSALYTSPMKLAEYLASGTPILASDVPALRGGLGDSATYFEPDSPDGLIQALRQPHRAPTAKPYTWEERARAIVTAITV